MNAALDGGVMFFACEEIGMDAWVSNELSGAALGDRRLDWRLALMLDGLSMRIGTSIELACHSQAATKAAIQGSRRNQMETDDRFAGKSFSS